jgi:hypothetical protein
MTIGFGPMLTTALLVLIGLKLGGVITWSWPLVLIPLWIGLGELVVIGFPLVALVLSAWLAKRLAESRIR